jgi:hypothetical protein
VLLCPASAAAVLLSEAQIYEGSVSQISCPSTSQCTASAGVRGFSTPGDAGQEVTFDPLAPSAPAPVTLDAGVDLFSIACPAVSQCTIGDESGELTFNPSAPGTPTSVELETGLTYSIACPEEDQCTATGYPGARAATFDPKEPEHVTNIWLGGGGQDVFNLACPSVSECVGVSNKGNEVAFNPQIPGTHAPVSLDAGVALGLVSCPSVSQCTTVGNEYEITFNPSSPDGSMSINVGGKYALDSIACPSLEQCTAGASKGMEVTFNPTAPGSPTPIHIDTGGLLEGWQDLEQIACPSTNQCTAVDQEGRELTFDPNTQSPAISPPSMIAPLQTSTSPTAPRVSAAELRTLLAQQLRPSGRGASIAALLKRGGYAFGFNAPEAGAATLDWYYLPHDATLAKRRIRSMPVTVAKGDLTCSGAGTSTMKIMLTAAGRRLLRDAQRLKLTAKGTFAPVGQAPVIATISIALAGK